MIMQLSPPGILKRTLVLRKNSFAKFKNYKTLRKCL